MEKQFHPTLYWECDYLSMVGWKLIHVNRKGPAWFYRREDYHNKGDNMLLWRTHWMQNGTKKLSWPWMKWRTTTSSNGNIFHVFGSLWGESTCHRSIPLTKASNAELWCFLCSAPEQAVEQPVDTLLIWDATALIMTSLWSKTMG